MENSDRLTLDIETNIDSIFRGKVVRIDVHELGRARDCYCNRYRYSYYGSSYSDIIPKVENLLKINGLKYTGNASYLMLSFGENLYLNSISWAIEKDIPEKFENKCRSKGMHTNLDNMTKLTTDILSLLNIEAIDKINIELQEILCDFLFSISNLGEVIDFRGVERTVYYNKQLE